jgi:hypothetical protein
MVSAAHLKLRTINFKLVMAGVYARRTYVQRVTADIDWQKRMRNLLKRVPFSSMQHCQAGTNASLFTNVATASFWTRTQTFHIF